MSDFINNKQVISIQEMGEMLDLSKNLAYRLARSRDFYPAIHLGRKTIISVPALQRWLNQANVIL